VIRLLRELRSRGVLGMNRRNADFTLRWNRRRLYPRVDDKLLTKQLCEAAGIPTPRLLAVARHHWELRHFLPALDDCDEFAVKPARGAMGNGILVIAGREGDGFLRASGQPISRSELLYHAASIISGLFALGGQPDAVFAEERLSVHPELREIATDGVPDLRIVVYRGIPLMAMTRLPTHRSRGRANLHQGAVGAGVSLRSGAITHAILGTAAITQHPDTGQPLVGRKLPAFERAVEIAVAATDRTELGYVGADVVVDSRYGPVVLELNARPGLSIQIANRAGLRPRLEYADRCFQPDLPPEERIALGREIEVEGARR
jgi:alpha-L-glutamate ligase-like protein